LAGPTGVEPAIFDLAVGLRGRSMGNFVTFTSDQKYGIVDKHYLNNNNGKVSGTGPGWEKMNRMRSLAQSCFLILVTALLISCSVSSLSVAPTATPVPPATRSEVPRITPEELKERLDNGEAILVVDSRTSLEFETGHIAGAISVPSLEVGSRLDELPRDQEIVFY
jgi:hypothetical protein